ncbi:hypothetical protein A3Q56_05353 [Intoshia linei]|uniref:Uncharacterized protein n=1 Tax=Intoshia linei TaxID=1819745 RepID=A0A177AXU1_9BILA|nr:hypothetical protein A3Q56_05353 [Intoshia linei]
MVKNRDVFQFKPISLRDVSLFHKPNRVIIEEIAEDKLKDLLDECYSARSKLFHSCHVECSLIAENKLKIINFLLRQYINKFTDHCDESILQFLKLSIMVCTDGITSNFNCRIFDIDENVLLAFLEGTVFTLSYNMNLTSKSINGIQMRGDFELYPSIIMTIESLNQYMKINKIHLKDTTSDKIRLKRQSTNAVLMQRLTQGTFSPIKLPDDIDVEVQK